MNESEEDASPQFSAEEWEQIKELVFESQEQQPADLNAWLDGQTCSDKVRGEVKRVILSGSACGNFLERPAVTDYFGTTRATLDRIGRYRIIEELGTGGMGVVYAAYDDELDRRVAIKVLPASIAADPELRKRLRWDAKAASALQHPNIVTVYEIGTHAGSDYVAMECITGKTLARSIPPGGLETAEVLAIAIQIASGLEAAHKAEIVHRDLKPSNIMITDTGVAKLLDFGLAKGSGAGFKPIDTPMTIEGRFAGTVAYVSPEQAEGKSVDARSDIFSFGSVLFEMSTGRRAFPGDSAISVLADILRSDPPDPTTLNNRIDERLSEIVERCLRRNRDRRFQTITEVKVRLEELEEAIQYSEQDRKAALRRLTRLGMRNLNASFLWGAATVAFLAMTLFLIFRGYFGTTERSFTIRRLTNGTGLSAFPTISRDGKALVYATDIDGTGNLDLRMQQLNGGGTLQLTSFAEDESEPAFAPNGASVVFRSEREGGSLYIVSAVDGSTARPLVAGGHNPQFSPDGRLVAFWRGEAGGGFYPDSAQVFIVPAAGGVPVRFRPDFAAAAYPVWSPKGDRLLFLGRRNKDGPGDVDWWVASVDGTYARSTGLFKILNRGNLRAAPGRYRFNPLVWLEQPNMILFPALHGDAINIWASRLNLFDTGSNELRRLTGGTGWEMQASVMTDSGGLISLVYSALTPSTTIWKVPLNNKGLPLGRPDRLIESRDGLSSPSVNSDGSRLVYVYRESQEQVIRVRDLKSGDETTVTKVRTSFSPRPLLSGDGQTVAYWDSESKSSYIVHVATGEQERICQDCSVPTHLSYDGRDVLVDSIRAPERILISEDRKALRPLIESTGESSPMQYSGRFSPDHRWVAFYESSSSSPDKHIWVAPRFRDRAAKQEELIPFTEGHTSDREPYWSAEGDRIIFLSDRDGFLCVWARDVDSNTGHPRGPVYPVVHLHHAHLNILKPSAYGGDIGLSVSKNLIVFSATEYAGNIWQQTETGFKLPR